MMLLELFPKSKLKITMDDKQKKLEALQSDIRQSFEDVKLGRVTKTSKIIQIFWQLNTDCCLRWAIGSDRKKG